tara:strand:+ start:652 stop:1044 length:393 start_codon:yes stop_codon:yes gene_type:complete
MTIEIKNVVFEDQLFASTMTKVNESPMAVKDAYWFNRIIKEVQKYGKDYIETKDKLIKEYGAETQPDDIKEGSVQIDPDRMVEFQEKLQELLDITFEIPFDKRKFPETLDLSPSELGSVELLFDMSSLED